MTIRLDPYFTPIAKQRWYYQSPREMETLSLELPRAIALHVSPEQFEAIALANSYSKSDQRELRLIDGE